MPVYVGTSGWQYRHWREVFYPKGLPQKAWLEHYTRFFTTVEVNNAFYQLPKESTFAAWAERTPDDFVVGVKASRYLTHIRRLREPAEPVALFLERAGHLGSKLGPVLLQLPPTLKAAPDLLDDTLSRFPSHVKVAVEPRHASWWNDEVRAVLERRSAALCLADRGSKPVTPLWRTVGWGYLRMHQGRATPSPCYGRTALESWAHRLAESFAPADSVYVFFNNDPGGCAVRDARWFAAAAKRAGLQPTRVPPAEALQTKLIG